MNARGLSAFEFMVLAVLIAIVGALFFGKQVALWQPAPPCAGNTSTCRQGAAMGSGLDCCKGFTCSEISSAPGAYQCVPG